MSTLPHLFTFFRSKLFSRKIYQLCTFLELCTILPYHLCTFPELCTFFKNVQSSKNVQSWEYPQFSNHRKRARRQLILILVKGKRTQSTWCSTFNLSKKQVPLWWLIFTQFWTQLSRRCWPQLRKRRFLSCIRRWSLISVLPIPMERTLNSFLKLVSQVPVDMVLLGFSRI